MKQPRIVASMALACGVLLAGCTQAKQVPLPPVPSQQVSITPTPTGAVQPTSSAEVVIPVAPLKVGNLVPYQDDRLGFTIDYPKNWKVEDTFDNPDCKAAVCFTAPTVEGSLSPAVVQVNAGSGLSSASSLQEAWNAARNQMVESYSGVHTIKQGDSTMAGEPSKTAAYTFEYGGQNGRAVQSMIFVSPDAYLFTGASAGSEWGTTQPLFEQMTASFALI